MLCLAVILLAHIAHPIRTAHVTKPTLLDTLDSFFEKLERLSVPTSNPLLSDDVEDMLPVMQAWGGLDKRQLSEVAKDLQRMKEDADEERTNRLDMEYADMEDNEEEYADIDYHNDGKEDEDDELSEASRLSSNEGSRDGFDEDTETSSTSPLRPGVTPLAFTRNEGYKTIVSAVGTIAATNERPRILDDSSLTAVDRKELRTAAYNNMVRAVHASNCLVPQARWLSVRQLAPSSDTMYMPPCVELHRCAPDSGCCNSGAEVCAPIEGRYVVIPFYLHKADGNNSVARMMFFNHTACACVARDTLQTTVHMPVPRSRHVEERQNDWRPAPTQGPTAEPKILAEEDVTAPPMMRRCTCPKYFQSSTSDGSCTCACSWEDVARRRECLYFSRGKEHLGLSDRVCIEHQDCAVPSCDYGPYDRRSGKCPARKYRRLRYHVRRHEKNVV